MYEALTSKPSVRNVGLIKAADMQLCRNIQDASNPGSPFEIAAAFHRHDMGSLLAYEPNQPFRFEKMLFASLKSLLC
jgi:hypothetical protein